MKPSPCPHATRFLLSAALLLVCPLLLTGQSKKNGNPPPPPPPQQQSRPAPAPQPQPQRQQQQPQQRPPQQPQRPSQGGTTNAGRVPGAGNTGTGPGNSGRGTNNAAAGTGKGSGVGGTGNGPSSAVRGANGSGAGSGAVAGGRGVGAGGVGNRAIPPKPPVKLAPVESQKHIQNLNANRTAMTGVNRNPLPQGQVTLHPNGAKTIVASGGRQFDLRSDGTVHKISLPDGRTATFHHDGTVSSIRSKDGIQIDRSLNGSRTIVSERNGQRIVSTGGERGYLQRNYVERGGRTYVQRTYVVNNTTYVNVYRTYSYRNVTYYTYVPAYYYRPVFYGWVYNPWPAPVYFAWGWNSEPWYSPYGYYFTPYPTYPSAAYWMTDFIISENLRAAYEAGAASANSGSTGGYDQQPDSNSQALSPQVKEMIAEEVKAQLAAEREAAAQGANTTPSSAPASSGANSDQLPPALDPNLKVFIVTTAMDVTAEGQACSLSAGDVLMRTETAPDSENAVGVSVLSSQKSDCATGSAPRVQVAALQEMHNHFREQMDNGLKTLAEKQGNGGLPSAPDVHTVAGEVPPPTADSAYALKKVKGQQQEADQAEKDIKEQAFTQKTS